MSGLKVRGVDEAVRALERVKLSAHDALDAATTAGAGVVAAEAKRRAPRRSGKLQGAIAVGDVDIKGSRAIAKVGLLRSVFGNSGFYGRFQEQGTGKMRARPYFGPGADAAKRKVETVVRRVFEAAVTRRSR